MNITLRPATMRDISDLYNWRNDQLTRSMSIRPNHVEWEDHEFWLSASLVNPKRTLLIAELDGTPVGTVRIDRTHEGAEMSWTVSPDQRGKGIGAAMVKQALPIGTLTASIKRENIASRRIAEKCGFVLIADERLQRWARPVSAIAKAA